MQVSFPREKGGLGTVINGENYKRQVIEYTINKNRAEEAPSRVNNSRFNCMEMEHRPPGLRLRWIEKDGEFVGEGERGSDLVCPLLTREVKGLRRDETMAQIPRNYTS